MARISGWIAFGAALFWGEVTDQWDMMGNDPPIDGWTEDQLAAVIAAVLIFAAFLAWIVEQVCEAIRGAIEGDDD